MLWFNSDEVRSNRAKTKNPQTLTKQCTSCDQLQWTTSQTMITADQPVSTNKEIQLDKENTTMTNDDNRQLMYIDLFSNFQKYSI